LHRALFGGARSGTAEELERRRSSLSGLGWVLWRPGGYFTYQLKRPAKKPQMCTAGALGLAGVQLNQLNLLWHDTAEYSYPQEIVCDAGVYPRVPVTRTLLRPCLHVLACGSQRTRTYVDCSIGSRCYCDTSVTCLCGAVETYANRGHFFRIRWMNEIYTDDQRGTCLDMPEDGPG